MANNLSGIAGTHVGFLLDNDPDTPNHAATVTITDDDIVLEVPLLAGHSDLYEAWFKDDGHPPEDLYLVTSQHRFHLSGLRHRGRRINFGSGLGQGTLAFRRLVRTGAIRPSYKHIHGLRIEIVGLPHWINPGVFTEEYGVSNDGRFAKVVHIGEGQPSINVAGEDELCLLPYFENYHDIANGVHTIRETMVVQTRFEQAKDWETHTKKHRALQDLMSLAFLWPCNASVEKALRVEDGIITMDGVNHGIEWHDSFVPVFGRRGPGVPVHPLPPSRAALFTFEDVGMSGLSRWFAEYDRLRRSLGVLSASFFREGGTIEVEMLQVAVALEALGYSLATSKSQQNAVFEKTIARIAHHTDANLTKVFGDFGEAETWAAAFNSAYLGVKHANREALEDSEVHQRAREGILLARLWLARHLGMSRKALDGREYMYYP